MLQWHIRLIWPGLGFVKIITMAQPNSPATEAYQKVTFKYKYQGNDLICSDFSSKLSLIDT